MTMPWTSYLMWEYPHVTSQVDDMTLFDRYEVIMDPKTWRSTTPSMH